MGEACDGRLVVSGLTKTFGPIRAVDDLSFTVSPGRVTGFLGPNGAGKTTTLRILLGLVAPTAGTATIGGSRYVDLPDPVHTVGASLEATGFHPGRTGRDHLRVLCVSAGLPQSRADETLTQVGLAEAARRRVGGYTLGMRQRLALAGALLGDPRVLVLDEPANGLDPEGIAWLRGFLRHLAGLGRTVLVSSHALAEVEQSADEVVILNRGRLVRQAELSALTGAAGRSVRVRTPDAHRLRTALENDGYDVRPLTADALQVAVPDPAAGGRVALGGRVELHELSAPGSDLEDVFLQLTAADQAAEDAA